MVLEGCCRIRRYRRAKNQQFEVFPSEILEYLVAICACQGQLKGNIYAHLINFKLPREADSGVTTSIYRDGEYVGEL
jgi:hypothetical protein